jgi:GGDEF domain-containing protein
MPWATGRTYVSAMAFVEVTAARRLGLSAGDTAGDQLARMDAEPARPRAERAASRWAVGHDGLTGPADRRLFKQSAPLLLRRRAPAAAVVLIDLDDFTSINDRLGHRVGDRVVRAIARRMTSGAAGDQVAPPGGDGFAAVLTRRGAERPEWPKPVIVALRGDAAWTPMMRGPRVAVVRPS